MVTLQCRGFKSKTQSSEAYFRCYQYLRPDFLIEKNQHGLLESTEHLDNTTASSSNFMIQHTTEKFLCAIMKLWSCIRKKPSEINTQDQQMIRLYLERVFLLERRKNMLSDTSGSNKPRDAKAIKKFLQYLFSLTFTVILSLLETGEWEGVGDTFLRNYKKCYSVFEP